MSFSHTYGLRAQIGDKFRIGHQLGLEFLFIRTISTYSRDKHTAWNVLAANEESLSGRAGHTDVAVLQSGGYIAHRRDGNTQFAGHFCGKALRTIALPRPDEDLL